MRWQRPCRWGLLILLAVAMGNVAQAQKLYYNHWAFGNGVHVDFSSGTPSVSCNVSINALEGCASYSDQASGQFIAYTDGQTVYNGQNNNVLANGTGLIGSSTSIEAALILPKPGASIDEFYIFHNNTTTHYWSEVDMNSGANGTVVSKNNFLEGTSTERCGSVPHGTICPAYWVVVSRSTNDSIAAYLVDTSGINTPVISSTGISGGNRRGNIVFSEDYSKIGMNVESKGMYVADFDNVTGLATNWVKIGNTTSGFGSAFSPDGTKVYYTNSWSANLYQYDFNTSTETFLGSGASSYPVLGRDNKVYVSRYGQQWLGVVNNPNGAGAACNFVLNGLAIPTGCQCRWGLPNPFLMDIGYHPPTPDTITLCPGEDTLYTTQVPGDTFLWNTGDTSASVLLDTAGLYWVTIGLGDCSSSDSVYLQYAEDVTIQASTHCLNDVTSFTHTTNMPAANIASYSWDFGDGSSINTSANPTYTYAQADTFSVHFELETNTGCILEADTVAIVHPLPIPNFTFDHECDGDAVSFTNTSQEVEAPISAFAWDIDNDATVDYSTTDVTHTYAGPGGYSAELWAIDTNGCADSLLQLVDVYPIPVADFGAPNECHHDLHEFSDSSQLAQGSIVQWQWDFGDGNTSTSQNPTHTYLNPGDKNVTLIVTSSEGCTDEKSKFTRVYHLPQPSFTVGSTCENVDAVFNSTNVSPSGNIVTYSWDFGDGSGSSMPDPSHGYPGPGAYDVEFYVVTNLGCSDTVRQSLRVYPAPVTAFGFENKVCVGEPLPFYDQSVIAQATPGGDSIVQWDWQVNGGFFSDQQNPVFVSSSHTTISVRLTTTSNYGCTTWAENIGNVYPNPVASFVTDPECQHFPTQFTSTSDIAFGIVDQWQWDFGDGNFSEEENPEHIYDVPNSYSVHLHVTSSQGCVDSVSGALDVRESPITRFDITPQAGCTEFRANLVNESIFTQPQQMSYEWYIDSVKVSEDKNASVWLENDVRDTVVFYSVQLIGKAINGCETSFGMDELIAVYPKPKAYFTTDGDLFHMLEPEVAFHNFSETGVRWLWEFEDSTSSNHFEPVHAYQNHGVYTVTLTAWNAYNCPDTFAKTIELEPFTALYVPSAFTPNGDGDNETWGVKGFNEGHNFRVRIWDRWGHMIYEEHDMGFAWDGKLSDGRLAPVGVYAYEILFFASDYEPRELTGQFTLLR